MSKYTTQVRYICEYYAGLAESEGGNSVNDIISKSWDKIFTDKFEIFQEDYRQQICSKILKHYYTREISADSVGLWVLWLNTRMCEIMPYYNKLYSSELLKFEPFDDVNYTRDNKNTIKSTGKTENNTTGNTTYTGSSETESNNKNLFSDTPQGGLDGVESNKYLTNATIDTNNTEQNTNDKTTSKSDSKTEQEADTTENKNETIKGKMGTTSYSKMLNEYRETFLNIDMMVINELKDLFILLW